MKMNKKIADMLCTLIVLGYTEDDSTGTKVFEYEKKEDLASYTLVQEAFSRFGVCVNVRQSAAKKDFPIILADTDRTKINPEYRQAIYDIEAALAKVLEVGYQSGKPKDLYGAYIGGFSQISSIDLLGASDLELYQSQLRHVDSTAIGKRYEEARDVSNKVISFLSEYKSGKKVKGVLVRVKDLNDPPEEYKEGHLFKSYHGMILSLMKYSSVSDKNTFSFEIAFSQGTKKVSSCFPCATFMVANNRPPSSTHLGRGDNWNIPNIQGSQIMKKAWKLAIEDWFSKGYSLLANKANGNALLEASQFTDYMQANNFVAKDVPKLFLVALTFESSFANKITCSL